MILAAEGKHLGVKYPIYCCRGSSVSPTTKYSRNLVLWFRYHHEDDRAIPGVCSLYGHPDHMVRTCVADVLRGRTATINGRLKFSQSYFWT